ncbi:STAS domain-containing protein [Streptomyces sp. NPDC004732]|uniref:STAS domain-containing protein n=1 Tax=Streptomyces sp. NPDC004732 TaxID=3154290 RepID=UPI0033B43645
MSLNSIEVTRQDRVAVVTLRHDIDLDNGSAVTAAFQSARSENGTKATLLDLAELTFADSALLNLILTARAEHEQAQRPFVLCGPLHSAIQRLFEITGVIDILVLADTNEDGVRELNKLLDG